ncbi:MAG: TIM-barrel domain-containing protein [Planctomycetota bacterium]
MLNGLSRAILSPAAVLLVTAGAAAQPVAESVGDRIVRFHASADARDAAFPSYALLDPNLPATGPAPAEFGPAPEFFTDDDGRSSFSINIEPGTSLYGTGEVPGPLQRNGRTTVLWNSDSYGYKDNTQSLYKSHPWVLAVREDGSAFGVIGDSTYRVTIDLSDGIRFHSDGPEFPVIVIDRDSPQEVVMALAELTGYMPMPPKWAIGYHQCRYSYYPDSRVREIATEFRARELPADVIWMDIHYQDEYRTFRFDSERFPDPKGLNEWLLEEKNFHNVWMINPGVAAETDRFPAEGYSVYEDIVANDYAVKTADGETYRGEVWPGWCVFPDYTRPDVREWWAGLYDDFMANGITGVWNDMNEPAIFNVPSKTMPEDNIHGGDPAMGGGGTHARFHNVFGMMMVKASREGIQAADPDKRPFVLSRAMHLGTQRYAAGWSGDNSADWWDLEVSVPMVLNMGLSGFPFYGPDLGGFIGNGDADQFERWFGFGTLLPFPRGHTAVGNRDKEPWAWGEEVENTARQALNNRYALLPYYYTLFHQAHTTGLPILRPLFFADPSDMALRGEDDSFLVGDALLVEPMLTLNADRAPVKPKGIWRPFELFGADNPDIPDMYLKGGTIVPTGPKIQYVGEKPLDPLTLHVSLDRTGRAEGILYEDAGDGYDYLDGDYLLTRYIAQRIGRTIVVRIGAVRGDRPRPDRAVRVRVMTDNGTFEATGRDGQPVIIDLGR